MTRIRSGNILFALCLICGGCGGGDKVSGPAQTQPSPSIALNVSINSGLDTLVVADTVQRTVTVTNSSGSSVTASVSWSSSDAAILSVNSTGLTVAKTPGTAVLTATATTEGASNSTSKTITVQPDLVTSVVVNAPSEIDQANGFEVSATAFGRHGRVLAATFNFSSSNINILSVGSDNIAVGGAVGTASITAVANGVSGTKSVLVKSVPVPIRILFITAATLAQKKTAYAAAARWQRVLSLPLTGADVVLSGPTGACASGVPSGTFRPAEGMMVLVSFEDLGGIAGTAGPCVVRRGANAWQQTTVLGVVKIDLAEYAKGGLDGTGADRRLITVTHEFGHALGIGAEGPFGQGPANSALVTGRPGVDPRWIGAEATREYRASGGTATSGVPLNGSDVNGSYGHWRNSQLMGEIMTQGTGNFLSKISLGYLADIGYKVDYSKADAYTVTVAPGVPPVTN